MSDSLKFTSKRNVIALTVDDANYELREMSASARDKYLDSMSGRVAVGADGKPTGLKKFDAFQGDLLALCLHDADGKLVDKSTIQGWPNGTVNEMFKVAQKLNHLNHAPEDAGKND